MNGLQKLDSKAFKLIGDNGFLSTIYAFCSNSLVISIRKKCNLPHNTLDF